MQPKRRSVRFEFPFIYTPASKSSSALNLGQAHSKDPEEQERPKSPSPQIPHILIDDLCMAISQRPQINRQMSRTVVGKDINWECLGPLDITTRPHGKVDVVSLETVLLDSPETLSKKNRLILGAKIASSMMQLHSTQWLGEGWGKRDIYILRKVVSRKCFNESRESLVWEYLVDRPFIHKSFSNSSSTLQDGNVLCATPSKSVVNHDRNLFSLGIILIELALQTVIENIKPRIPRTSTISATSSSELTGDFKYYTAARDCIGEIFDLEQENYGNAVQRCIQGLSLPVNLEKDLENLTYMNEVQVNIISLLEKNLKVFS